MYICFMKHTIYTLSHPITNIVRYIGKTNGTLPDRLSKHIYISKKANNKRCNWIQSLIKQGIKPKIEVLDTCTSTEESSKLEIYWISQFRSWGFDLVNGTDGGEGSYGYKPSKETLEKKRATMKALWINKKKPPIKRMSKEEQYALLSDKRSIPINQYSLFGVKIKTWKSINEVTKEWKCSSWSITQALKHSNRVGLDFFWRYQSKEDRSDIEVSFKEVKRVKFIFTHIDSKKEYEFEGIHRASKGMNTTVGCIYSCLGSNRLFKKKFKIKKEIYYGSYRSNLYKQQEQTK